MIPNNNPYPHKIYQSLNRKIYVVGAASYSKYANWMQGKATENLEEADVVVFTGGADVSPSLYGEPAHVTTSPDLKRDNFETDIFRIATERHKPIIGICRGAQLACVMAGGRLIQHQPNEKTVHICTLANGDTIEVTSDHHQAMYPWGLLQGHWKKLGWTNAMHAFHLGGRGEEMVNDVIVGHTEIEEAYFPKIRALAIQSHPEYVYPPVTPKEYEYISHCQEMLTNLITGAI